MTVDWSFLRSLEGFSLSGYVPRDAWGKPVGHSGVTIATGVDLGQMSADDIKRLALPPRLLGVLPGYCGITGDFAARAIQAHPFSLSLEEASALDDAVAAPKLKRLHDAYNAVTLPVDLLGWDDLPPAVRTIMFSVAWQYGPVGEETHCKRFWRSCCIQDWPGVVKELLNFGDQFPTRRRKEAVYLAATLNLPIGQLHDAPRSGREPTEPSAALDTPA